MSEPRMTYDDDEWDEEAGEYVVVGSITDPCVVDFNDDFDTTKDDVLAVFDAGIAKARELADVA